jgi:hypothetical protein
MMDIHSFQLPYTTEIYGGPVERKILGEINEKEKGRTMPVNTGGIIVTQHTSYSRPYKDTPAIGRVLKGKTRWIYDM